MPTNPAEITAPSSPTPPLPIARVSPAARIRHVAALIPAWLTIACSLPGPVTPRDQLARLERFTYAATLDQTEVSVRAYRSGSQTGRRVIYIHGTPGDALSWGDYLAEPIPGTQSIAIDRPGFGVSSSHRAFPSLADQAAAIEPLLKPAAEPAILVGHSLGAPIAAAVAAQYPDRVAGLVLLAGSLDPDLEKILFIQHVGEFGPMPGLLPRWLRNTNRELLPLRAELEALEPRLAEIQTPIEIVHGTKDAQVPYANVEFMRTRLTNAAVRITTLEGTNHFLPWNSGAEVRAAIQRVVEAAP
ncbi:MAG: alpha/beta hydrolase [Planctomycetota bacterium]